MLTSGEGRDYYDERVTCDSCGAHQMVVIAYDFDDNSWWWDCGDCDTRTEGSLF